MSAAGLQIQRSGGAGSTLKNSNFNLGNSIIFQGTQLKIMTVDRIVQSQIEKK